MNKLDKQLFACATPHGFPAARYRDDFPIFEHKIHGKPLIYLDSGASAQKPRMVLEAMQRFYEKDYANIHRGVHELSMRATDKYEAARERTRQFLNAAHSDEIIFTHGATDAINLVAMSWGLKNLGVGDEVLITEVEHHSNIVPWHLLREKTGVTIRAVRVREDGEIHPEDFAKGITERTKLIAMAHVSNTIGTLLPVAAVTQMAKAKGIKVLVDGCQAAPHMGVDVRALDVDFYVFAPHKAYGPTGIGVLYIKKDSLKDMPPYQGGGGTIQTVTLDETVFREAPARYEAGTPPIAEAVGTAAALDYIATIGLDRIAQHENALLGYAVEQLLRFDTLRLVGMDAQTVKGRAAVLSFVMEDAHAHDVGTILDREGVAIRAGHHCAQPLMQRFGVPATIRVSFGLYNTFDDVDALVKGLHKVREIFG